MSRLGAITALALAASSCMSGSESGCLSGSEPAVQVECYADEDTCRESLCPELCETDGEVVIANCYKPPWNDQYAPGECYCLCEDEGEREACFAFGIRGADFTYEWFDTATECGDSDTCDSVCERECVFGFGSMESRCEESVCECLCGVCQFTG